MSIASLLAPAIASALAPPAPEPSTNPELDAATRGRLGMQVRGVEIDTGHETYRLTERSWGDVVRDNPALLADQRRTELFAPGLAGVGLGGLWLSIATAVTIDQYAERRRREGDRSTYGGLYDDEHDPVLSARAVTFRFIIPSAILITGAAMAIAGGRARRRLDEARGAFYLGPQLSQGGGGLAAGGRF